MKFSYKILQPLASFSLKHQQKLPPRRKNKKFLTKQQNNNSNNQKNTFWVFGKGALIGDI